MEKDERQNIYKRGRKWWARITVAGKEHRYSLRTDDKGLALRRADEKRKTLIAEAHFGENRPLWTTAVVEWAKHATPDLSPKTMMRYAVSLKQLEPFLSGLFVDQIDRKLVSDIVKGRRSAGASTATIRRDLTALSSVLNFCQDEYDLDNNPALERSRRLKERRDPIILPNASDVDRLIAKAPGNLAHMISIARLTGARQDELVTADRRNVDWSRRQFTVIGKRNKRRTLSLSDAAYEALRRVPAHIRSTVLFHHDGEPYANVSSRFAELRASAQKAAQSKGASFRPFRFHDLRHLYAVEYLKDGGNIYTLKGLLGHTSVKTTEIYLEYLTPEEQQRAKFGRTKDGTPVTVFGTADDENANISNALRKNSGKD